MSAYIRITIRPKGKTRGHSRTIVYQETGARPKVGDVVSIKGESAEWCINKLQVLDETPLFIDFKKGRKRGKP